jgi:hypothetical protein
VGAPLSLGHANRRLGSLEFQRQRFGAQRSFPSSTPRRAKDRRSFARALEWQGSGVLPSALDYLEGDTMNITALIVELISGAAGGNIAGALLKKLSLGPVGNSIAGIVGGGIGGQVLGMLMGGGGAAPASGAFDIGSLVAQIGGGGVGGAILMAIVGAIRNAMAKST